MFIPAQVSYLHGIFNKKGLYTESYVDIIWCPVDYIKNTPTLQSIDDPRNVEMFHENKLFFSFSNSSL